MLNEIKKNICFGSYSENTGTMWPRGDQTKMIS